MWTCEHNERSLPPHWLREPLVPCCLKLTRNSKAPCYRLVKGSRELIHPLMETLMSALQSPLSNNYVELWGSLVKGATEMCSKKPIWGKVRDKQMENERERGMRGTRWCFRQATEGESKSHRQSRRDIKLNSKSLAQQIQHSPIQQDFSEVSTKCATITTKDDPPQVNNKEVP